ncbi:MAG: hypothetical protein Q8916_13110 [Bacteroidota bacterium]|nr:hypothetical protein [Bacteroidota bacterium]MDP4231331.1 hypothetical protein [Bacteroidota bacterium]MDP4237269.1 hypothetical protein [Bacteroidota bacterium]
MTTYEIEILSSIKRGAVSLFMGNSTGTNITDSLRVAREIAHTLGRGKVLYINTVQTKRQLSASVAKLAGNPEKTQNILTSDPNILYLTSVAGMLSSMEEFVRKALDRGVKFIIINSLEFSSKDYRRRDELIFQIMQWMNSFGTGVLLFAESPRQAPRRGKIQRSGGAGKLAALAKTIVFSADPEDEYRMPEKEDENDDFEDFEEFDPEDEERDIEAFGEIVDDDDDADTPEWKPANMDEEIAICQAYKKNHPEFKAIEGEIWIEERERILALIAEEKRRHAKRLAKQQKKQAAKEKKKEKHSPSPKVAPDGAIVYSADKPAAQNGKSDEKAAPLPPNPDVPARRTNGAREMLI